MSNVLSTDKKQQVISLGKLGWSLRRIEEATGVRRETASVYLKAAGVAVCLPGWRPHTGRHTATGVRRETASAYLKAAGAAMCLPGRGRRAPAKPAIQVTP